MLRFKKAILDFKSSGVLNALVLDYLNKKENLQPFFDFFPDNTGFSELLRTQPYSGLDRKKLSEILLQQCQLVTNTSEDSKKKIEQLTARNTFTVTTGHQLCLFTGPLYFIYKILSTINLAELLNKEFSEYNFVPVYWMASEDHDFDEVSSFNAFGKTLTWESEQQGAVGDFDTHELETLLPAMKEMLGTSDNANYLGTLFENAYLKNVNLANATRHLVNELFGEHGLVIADGNDIAFKHQFKDYFKKDIFENLPNKLVNESIRSLESQGYSAQVNPRLINCFYLESGLRARLEDATGERYKVVGTNISFTKKELENIIDANPEKISPNVVLRPLYQQFILPNIAYVGGPGELAYWLEFKNMFHTFGVVFPILMPRNFVSFIDKSTKNKIDKLDFLVTDFFKSEQELIKHFQLKSNHIFDTFAEREKISVLYSELIEKVVSIDKTLSGSVSGELQKALNGLDLIAGKANKALKQKSETEINQIKNIKLRLFPNGIPQERYENFSSLYLKYGPSFLTELKEFIDPFAIDQKIAIEE
jgi:bacillithiol biosynthesis cysteine-adding enzyme BshC